MSYRVTTAEVQAIMRGDFPSDVTDATPFIAVANTITNLLIGNAAVDASFLPLIELYLSAHFTMGKDLKEEKTGEGEDKYWEKAGYGFMLTSYGQQAVAFDSSKTLADMCDPVNSTLSFHKAYRY